MYYCRRCLAPFDTLTNRCPACREWNTLTEGTPSRARARKEAVALMDIERESFGRLPTNTRELDRVLGGGFARSGVYALTGEPGAGKSTLALQVAADLSMATVEGERKREKVLYVSAEEADAALRDRAERIARENDVYVLTQDNAIHILEVIAKIHPSIVFLDSISTLYHPESDQRAGTVQQVLACASMFVNLAKSSNIVIVFIAHIVKDGSMAGPKSFEHLIDCSLSLENERGAEHRVLRASKNRFGPTDEVGIFSMTAEGLRSIDNPVALHAESWTSGCALGVLVEGSRAMVVEVQALVTPSNATLPKRNASGVDRGRLDLLLAVLARHAGVACAAHDVWVNIVGGMVVSDPSLDLPLCIALASGRWEHETDTSIAFFGEVGLGGEIRTSARTEARIKQAQAMGISLVVGPPWEGMPQEGYLAVHHLTQAFDAASLAAPQPKAPKALKKRAGKRPSEGQRS